MNHDSRPERENLATADEEHGNTTSDTSSSPVASQAELASQVQHLSHLSKTLSDEKNFLRSVLDSTADAIVAFNRHGAFVVCNRRFETLFDITATDLAGHDESWLRQQLRERLEAPENFWGKLCSEETICHDVVRLLATSRTPPYVLNWYSGPILDDSGALAGRIAVQRDITRETEVDQMKTDFVSIVSHELRTPMTSIRGYVDLILDGDTGEITELQRQFLKAVQRNTFRLTAMVNDMLDISRIEGGGIEFNLRSIPLQGIIEQVAAEAQSQITAKGLALTIISEDGSGASTALPTVLGDHDRLMQAFANLLSNAVKYTPAPPESPGEISIVVRVNDGMVDMAVRDTGIGISPEDQAMLFKKFFRANNPQTRDVDGTGLGLSITRALVEKMGGELHVHSEPGKGSEFSFSLPLAVPPAQAATTPE